MSKFPLTTLIMAFVALALPGATAQTKQQEYWEPTDHSRIEIDPAKPEIRSLISRWEEIGNGLKTTTNPFAGTYEKQSYRGYFLRWSPEKGFIYVYHSEGTSIIDFSYGKVRVTPEAIVFLPEREMRETFREEKLRTPSRWVPIAIERQFFLVPEERVKDFGDYVGGFGAYNDFNGPCCEFSPFFSKEESEVTPSKSTLSNLIPFPYQHLINHPIKAEIIFVGKKTVVNNYGLDGELYSNLFPRASLTPIVINAGRAVRVKKSMLFRLIGEPHGQYLRIIRVRNKTSDGLLIRYVDDDGSETFSEYDSQKKDVVVKPFPAIHTGTKVTTSPISNF